MYCNVQLTRFLRGKTGLYVLGTHVHHLITIDQIRLTCEKFFKIEDTSCLTYLLPNLLLSFDRQTCCSLSTWRNICRSWCSRCALPARHLQKPQRWVKLDWNQIDRKIELTRNRNSVSVLLVQAMCLHLIQLASLLAVARLLGWIVSCFSVLVNIGGIYANYPCLMAVCLGVEWVISDLLCTLCCWVQIWKYWWRADTLIPKPAPYFAAMLRWRCQKMQEKRAVVHLVKISNGTACHLFPFSSTRHWHLNSHCSNWLMRHTSSSSSQTSSSSSSLLSWFSRPIHHPQWSQMANLLWPLCPRVCAAVGSC